MPSITDLRADRPFYFQIVAEKEDVVLFAGTVRSPTETTKMPSALDEDREPEPRIFFATRGGGIKLQSGEYNVKTVVDSKENLNGITYDPVNQFIYYSSSDRIYRANMDGTHVVTVLDSKECKFSQFPTVQSSCQCYLIGK